MLDRRARSEKLRTQLIEQAHERTDRLLNINPYHEPLLTAFLVPLFPFAQIFSIGAIKRSCPYLDRQTAGGMYKVLKYGGYSIYRQLNSYGLLFQALSGKSVVDGVPGVNLRHVTPWISDFLDRAADVYTDCQFLGTLLFQIRLQMNEPKAWRLIDASYPDPDQNDEFKSIDKSIVYECTLTHNELVDTRKHTAYAALREIAGAFNLPNENIDAHLDLCYKMTF